EASGIAAPHRLGEQAQYLAVAFAVHGKARTLVDHMRPCPTEDLSARGGVSSDRRSNLFKAQVERAAQHENHAFQWGQPFKKDEQRERDVLGAYAGLVFRHERLG